ncbi:hypothetical protein AVEN_215609-1 [Araneus ventricosus]|uniref:Uncharacterized protein n=1 Tax=Araneus ventricosus TaxID=182803 RepID=A0A4Y2TDE5_ARAVE|nr:hypothetical protein AVEN_215609-1 [Araneus ventricosus]
MGSLHVDIYGNEVADIWQKQARLNSVLASLTFEQNLFHQEKQRFESRRSCLCDWYGRQSQWLIGPCAVESDQTALSRFVSRPPQGVTPLAT